MPGWLPALIMIEIMITVGAVCFVVGIEIGLSMGIRRMEKVIKIVDEIKGKEP